jgi:hypothetical protein
MRIFGILSAALMAGVGLCEATQRPDFMLRIAEGPSDLIDKYVVLREFTEGEHWVAADDDAGSLYRLDDDQHIFNKKDNTEDVSEASCWSTPALASRRYISTSVPPHKASTFRVADSPLTERSILGARPQTPSVGFAEIQIVRRLPRSGTTLFASFSGKRN